MFDKNLDGAKKVAGEIKGFACGVDITDYKAVAEAIAAFEKAAGPTDILVNNAGWDQFVPLRRHDARALGQGDRHQPATARST